MKHPIFASIEVEKSKNRFSQILYNQNNKKKYLRLHNFSAMRITKDVKIQMKVTESYDFSRKLLFSIKMYSFKVC